MTKKVYARQSPAEEQESPLGRDWDCINNCWEGIYLYGNCRLRGLGTSEIIEKLVSRIFHFAEEDVHGISLSEGDVIWVCKELPNWKSEAAQDLSKWTSLIRSVYGSASRPLSDICREALELATGEPYRYKEIHGSSQGEWQGVYFPSRLYMDEAIRLFEIEYFDLGTEWIVQDDDSEPEPEEAGDVMGYSFYCHDTDLEKIRRDIAELSGVEPEDVLLYACTGMKWTPVYDLVPTPVYEKA